MMRRLRGVREERRRYSSIPAGTVDNVSLSIFIRVSHLILGGYFEILCYQPRSRGNLDRPQIFLSYATGIWCLSNALHYGQFRSTTVDIYHSEDAFISPSFAQKAVSAVPSPAPTRSSVGYRSSSSPQCLKRPTTPSTRIYHSNSYLDMHRRNLQKYHPCHVCSPSSSLTPFLQPRL